MKNVNPGEVLPKTLALTDETGSMSGKLEFDLAAGKSSLTI